MVSEMVKCLNNEITEDTLLQRIGIIRENIRTAALSGGFDPQKVRLMAVTKYVGAEAVLRAVQAGITLIGENREQALSQKLPLLPREQLQVHFIGHLQRNKAARVVRMVDMVESLDSPALAAELEKQAAALEKTLPVLIEVNIGKDSNKSGIAPETAAGFAESLQAFPHLQLRGLMTILPLGAAQIETERYFSQMHALYVDIQEKNRDNGNIDCLSMGMSGDYKLAVKYGANLVRLGTVLFS
jgi:pyridoxal phosphate enzyme (YggS family)